MFDPGTIERSGLGDDSTELSRKEVVTQTLTWIRQRTPVAIVRFGEGEGRLLTADPMDPLSMSVAARKLRRQTGVVYPPEEVLRIKARVLNAFDTADVIGIRGSASFNDEHKMWVERIERVFQERMEQGRGPAYVSHCLLNNQLRDALPAILERQHRVSVISCRDVKPRLMSTYGVEDVRVFQVPSQYVVRDVDGEYEAAMHDVPIWPEFYEDLRDTISVRERGEVFLIGAGVFGKDLCTRVRDLGGIALDLGSSLDGMADKVTRGPNKPKPYTQRP